MAEPLTVILKIVILFGFLAGMVHLHENAHASICEYGGGHASSVGFFKTLCTMNGDNYLEAQAHLLDSIVEIVSMVFSPVMVFILIRWVEKE